MAIFGMYVMVKKIVPMGINGVISTLKAKR